ncbi:arginine/serine-rich protein PNISR isoform X1 [Drosophila novamexicana]|uniref:arginine/serine-rich protein PNISR isoform X1 n=2 Tax=Drosophila novamexicana TaxID=47314 RepID=UPI0011E5D8DA|nr:arginine/serine-rich protein PNISR isoform X1 [Drosophila novamexicana]
MFPSGNTNADLGFNKHNQYMAQPPHFLTAPGPGPGPVPGPGVGNPLGAAAPVMPMNMQGSIDWAQLAQQWIHMRDSSAAPPLANFSVNIPIAPPPPIISNAPEYHLHHQQELRQRQPKAETHYQEHGEAEMDMDLDDEDNDNIGRAMHSIDHLPPPPVVTQSQWMAGGPNDVHITVSSNDAVGSDTQQWNDWSTRNNPTAHIPSLLKLNVCNPNEPAQLLQQTQQPLPIISSISGGGSGSVSTEIDANKRKMLPAWIREGLEKMEREKQRQLERQQPPTPETESPAFNVKQVSSKTLTTSVNILNMSNVASDSEDSIAAPEEATHAPNLAQLIGNDVLSKGSHSDEEQDDDEEEEQQQQQNSRQNVGIVARAANAEAALSGKNYEERLADLMLVVRRTLTEILLETTNEEIAAIATETLKAHRAKASSAQVIRKSALSSITGNLGLAVYGDSSSESDEDNADDNDGDQIDRNLDSSADKSSELSADELKARIRKSKRAFARVIDDIEERVSLQEQLDEQKLQQHRKQELERTEAARHCALTEQRHTDPPAEETATTASANDKLQKFNGKRLSRKERTTRFSDNKDGKQPQSYVSQVVAVAAAQNSIMPQKLKPVPNPATNLLQMPESMASILSAADKALDKANKTSKKSKSRRRQSSSSSSSSSSGDSSSSSSSSDSNTSSNSSKTSSNSEGSSTRSSAAVKKHRHSSHRQSRGSSGHRQRSDSSRKAHHKGQGSSSMHNYDRHHGSRESRERDRNRERHAVSYSRQRHERRRRHQRDSSQSAEEKSSRSYRRNSRHSSSRSHQSSSYGKHRERTRSRSNSRSTHNSHSSVSASHQQRKRK